MIKDATVATAKMLGLSVAAKNELLFSYGINFNDLPAWHKRGVGCYWQLVEKTGYNPLTQEAVIAQIKQIKYDLELPMKESYDIFIRQLISS
jgi:tRNA(His) 5'-end guanylyltransferase